VLTSLSRISRISYTPATLFAKPLVVHLETTMPGWEKKSEKNTPRAPRSGGWDGDTMNLNKAQSVVKSFEKAVRKVKDRRTKDDSSSDEENGTSTSKVCRKLISTLQKVDKTDKKDESDTLAQLVRCFMDGSKPAGATSSGTAATPDNQLTKLMALLTNTPNTAFGAQGVSGQFLLQAMALQQQHQQQQELQQQQLVQQQVLQLLTGGAAHHGAMGGNGFGGAAVPGLGAMGLGGGMGGGVAPGVAPGLGAILGGGAGGGGLAAMLGGGGGGGAAGGAGGGALFGGAGPYGGGGLGGLFGAAGAGGAGAEGLEEVLEDTQWEEAVASSQV
jgi:hypothetical protein